MRSIRTTVMILVTSTLLLGCSVFGHTGVKTPPYTLLKADKTHQIEVRNYPSLVLVSTDMASDGRNSAFRRLFNYIDGNNDGAREIAMTAPVIMDNNTSQSEGMEIAMTAPVLMGQAGKDNQMSFVMPADFTLENTPRPTDPRVTLSEVRDYKVATIHFSGTLSDSNVEEHTQKLTQWISENGYTAISQPVNAAYNGPFTLPWLRTNEIFIQVTSPSH